MICQIAGKHPKIVFDTTKPEERLRKCADTTRLRQVTDNYVPSLSLREGIAEIECYE